ncbi:MAG: hypothetical protein FJX64_08185 [Alphaproteobacteria bacterium]|nr:hypothetical protein [Alphaproteobacteria bacterium]
MSDGGEIRTPRLILRAPRADDAAAIAALANDWDVVRQTASLPFPYTEADARIFIDGGAGLQLLLKLPHDAH